MEKCAYGKDIYVRMRRMTRKTSAYLDDFDCGNPTLNSYIAADQHDVSTVSYLFIDDGQDAVISYVSIACAGVIVLSGKDEELVEEHPYLRDTPVFDELTTLSMMEIKIFAADEKYQHVKMHKESKKHDTLGSRILRQTLFMLKNISSRHIGSKGVLLYSVPDKENFYARHGFGRFPYEMRRNAGYFEDCVPMIMLWPWAKEES